LSHNCTGTPALTSRGFVEEDFAKVADFFDAAVNLAVKIKAATTGIYIFLFKKKVYCCCTETFACTEVPLCQN
jgi:glycine/serine hydroxymethyltransferase